MSTRGAYELEDGLLVRTQGEVPKGQPVKKIGIPVAHQELIDFINGVIMRERSQAVAPIDSHIERKPFDAPFDEPTEPAPPPPSRDEKIVDRQAIEEMWDILPLQFRFHLCSRTMEEARNVDWMKTEPAKAPQRHAGVKGQ